IRTFGGPNRWGDYTSITLDPSDNSTFWTYNQYAATRGDLSGGEDGRWATRFGKFLLAGSPPLAPTSPDLTVASDTGVSSTDNITPNLLSSPALSYLLAPHSMSYSFSENVQPTLSDSDVTVQNTTTSTTIPTASLHFDYNAGTNVATLTFPGLSNVGVNGLLPDGNYTNTIAS